MSPRAALSASHSERLAGHLPLTPLHTPGMVDNTELVSSPSSPIMTSITNPVLAVSSQRLSSFSPARRRAMQRVHPRAPPAPSSSPPTHTAPLSQVCKPPEAGAAAAQPRPQPQPVAPAPMRRTLSAAFPGQNSGSGQPSKQSSSGRADREEACTGASGSGFSAGSGGAGAEGTRRSQSSSGSSIGLDQWWSVPAAGAPDGPLLQARPGRPVAESNDTPGAADPASSSATAGASTVVEMAAVPAASADALPQGPTAQAAIGQAAGAVPALQQDPSNASQTARPGAGVGAGGAAGAPNPTAGAASQKPASATKLTMRERVIKVAKWPVQYVKNKWNDMFLVGPSPLTITTHRQPVMRIMASGRWLHTCVLSVWPWPRTCLHLACARV